MYSTAFSRACNCVGARGRRGPIGGPARVRRRHRHGRAKHDSHQACRRGTRILCGHPATYRRKRGRRTPIIRGGSRPASRVLPRTPSFDTTSIPHASVPHATRSRPSTKATNSSRNDDDEKIEARSRRTRDAAKTTEGLDPDARNPDCRTRGDIERAWQRAAFVEAHELRRRSFWTPSAGINETRRSACDARSRRSRRFRIPFFIARLPRAYFFTLYGRALLR